MNKKINKEIKKSKIKVLLFINFCFCCIIGLVLAIFLSSYSEQNLISYTTYLIIKVISSIYFLVSVGAFIKYVYLPTAFAFNKEAIKKQRNKKELNKKNAIQDDADDIYRMK